MNRGTKARSVLGRPLKGFESVTLSLTTGIPSKLGIQMDPRFRGGDIGNR